MVVLEDRTVRTIFHVVLHAGSGFVLHIAARAATKAQSIENSENILASTGKVVMQQGTPLVEPVVKGHLAKLTAFNQYLMHVSSPCNRYSTFTQRWR